MVGYFATIPLVETNGFHLASLMVSSGLLYIAGIVLNDYFDIEVDRRERPFRPLPSGSIPKEHAMAIALAAIAAANIIALAASPTSFAMSLTLTAAIIAYDYRLKRRRAAAFSMGSTRFLNVILGASIVMSASSGIGTAIFAAALLFAYVIAIMILSRKEVGNEKPKVLAAFSIIFGVVASIVAIGLLVQFQWVFLMNLAIFTAVMAVIFKQLLTATSGSSVPQAVKNMVLSIIILDSVFVAGTAGLLYSLSTLLFIIPAVLLAKKLYVT